jgi:hypothetical protein
MKYPVVYVVWKDHAEADSEAWQHVSKLSDNTLVDITTIGFLVHESEDAIQVAASFNDKYEIVGRPDVIAKALIIHRVELQVAEYKPIKKKIRRANV